MGDDARLRLDDQLCFALYAATNAVVRAYRPLLRDLGLTYPQYVALMALWQHGELRVGALARRLSLPGHALTPVLQRLERAGLVERRTSPTDARSVLVRTTAAGRDLERSAAEAQRRVVCATGLSPEALAALRGELHDLVDHLDDTESTQPSQPSQPTTPEGRAS